MTSAADYMPQIRERLGAAWEYIENFQLKSREFFDSKPYTIIREEQLQWPNKVIRFRFKVLIEIPIELRRPLTACIGELRPILDTLVYGLSQIEGKNTSFGIKFPIYLTESVVNPKVKTFDTWIRDNNGILSKFPTGALDLIRRLQPFNPDNGGQKGSGHILYVLNRLANQHKHKALLKIAGINQNDAFVIGGKPWQPVNVIIKGPIQFGKPIEHNSIIREIIVPASTCTGLRR